MPADVIAALDARAGRLGLSRSEYVRRRPAQDAAVPGTPESVEDLARFADVFADLADPDVMTRAWRVTNWLIDKSAVVRACPRGCQS